MKSWFFGKSHGENESRSVTPEPLPRVWGYDPQDGHRRPVIRPPGQQLQRYGNQVTVDSTMDSRPKVPQVAAPGTQPRTYAAAPQPPGQTQSPPPAPAPAPAPAKPTTISQPGDSLPAKDKEITPQRPPAQVSTHAVNALPQSRPTVGGSSFHRNVNPTPAEQQGNKAPQKARQYTSTTLANSADFGHAGFWNISGQ